MTAEVSFNKEFYNILSNPSYIIQGFYYNFMIGTNLNTADTTANYIANTILYKDHIDISFELPEGLRDDVLTFMRLYYIDLFNHTSESDIMAEDIYNDNIYFRKKMSELLNWVCTIKCRYVDGEHNKSILDMMGGSNIIRLIPECPIKCDLKTQSLNYIRHLNSNSHQKVNYFKSNRTNLIDIHTGSDVAYLNSMNRASEDGVFNISKSGLIEI